MVFLAGLIVGILMSTPVGPMGLLAAYHAANRHVHAAWMLGLGVCLADGLLALLATLTTTLNLPHKPLAVLLALIMSGLAVWLWKTADKKARPPHTAATFSLGLGATLLHPANIGAFALAFNWLAGQGIVIHGLWPKIALVIGVFIGAMVMWGILIQLSARLGEKVAMTSFQKHFKRSLAILSGLAALVALSGAF